MVARSESIVGRHEHEVNNKQVKAHFWNKPLNPLHRSFEAGLRQQLTAHDAIIQEDRRNLAADTNFVVTYAEFGRDVDPLHMAVFRLPKHIKKYDAKVLGVVNVPHIPEFEEMDPRFLEKILDQPEGTDRSRLIELARERLHSPALAVGYPEMAYIGANLVLLLEGADNSEVPTSAYLIGLEQSYPQIPLDGDFFQNFYDLVEPQVLSRLVIKNKVRSDIVVPRAVFERSPLPRQLIEASLEEHRLGLYPDPFPLKRVVNLVKQGLYDLIFGITGLSYGNTSARALGELAKYGKFLMSQSGVKKDSLTEEQVLLALGATDDLSEMQIAAREGVRYTDSTRVSVDAIEVEQIYREFPDINVTAHGHVWLIDPRTGEPIQPDSEVISIGDDAYVVCTGTQYPCGGFELGREAADATRRSPRPSKTIVLEKRHGIVAFGESYQEMFERLWRLRNAGLITPYIPQPYQ